MWFEEQVARTPERSAVRFAGVEVSYRELNDRANRLAHALRARGIGRETLVALVVDKSLEMIVSLLGVLKAGGAYVPIDPEAPQSRIDYLLEDCGAELVVTREHLLDRLQGFSGEVFVWERESLAAYSTVSPPWVNEPDDLAYLIYTSGSTGKPKGTMLCHRGVGNLALVQADVFEIHEGSRVLQTASFSFDASVLEVFFALLRGGMLVLADAAELRDPLALTALLERERITFTLLSPAMLQQLPADAGPHLEVVVSGGDACPARVAEVWSRRVHFLNAYGPTEATVCATAWSSRRDGDAMQPLPIGRALPNSRVYVLDESLEQVPTGTSGEIYIAGPGVARGYWKRPELTAERFVEDPFCPGERMYRSGDLGRFREDGMLEFLGRADQQVKIRGFRIELGEIEAVLREHPSVRDCTVAARDAQVGFKQLVAYVVPEVGSGTDGLRAFVKRALPEYMVPAHFIEVASIPLTLSGKVDHRALPAPEEAVSSGLAYQEPQNERQRLIADAWKDVLGVKRVGIRDEFFEMGGNSLSILPILMRLKPHFATLQIQDFYNHPTVEQLEAWLRQQEGTEVTELSEWEAAAERVVYEEQHALAGAEWVRPQGTLLLTGATGYLGAHLLLDLLTETQAKVVCLVRASGGVSPEERLEEVMRFYHGSDSVERMRGRVKAVRGDLAAEGLGLSAEDSSWLEEEVDAILHCGADVRHYGDEDAFARVNVRATELLLALARKRKGVRFYYVSTLSVSDADVGSAYLKSKGRSEELVRDAMRTGMAAAIFRVGNLIGHSKTGRFQRKIEENAFYRVLKASMLLGAMGMEEGYVDLTPVDACSRALTHLTGCSDALGRTLHVCNPTAATWTDVGRWLGENGYEMELMEPERFRQLVYGMSGEEVRAEAVELIAAHVAEMSQGGTAVRFDTRETQRLLKGSGIVFPDPGRDLVERMVRYGRGVGFFPGVPGAVTAP